MFKRAYFPMIFLVILQTLYALSDGPIPVSSSFDKIQNSYVIFNIKYDQQLSILEDFNVKNGKMTNFSSPELKTVIRENSCSRKFYNFTKRLQG